MFRQKIKRAIIIGGGPGGLTAAIGLRQIGVNPVVYERARERLQVGSGLTLWSNALQAIEALTLAEAIRSVSEPLAGMAMNRWDGKQLFYVPPDVMEGCYGGAGMALHRSELMAVLLNELGDGFVHYNAQCIGFQQDDRGVKALFEDGSEARGDILIGADGIRSTIRAQLFGKTELRYAGFTVWRGVAEFALAQKVGVTSLGRGAQFGLFALTRNRVYWFASANASAGEQDGPGGGKPEVFKRFAHWHSPIKAVIESTNEADILRNDIYDLEPLARWSEGRVTLVGDAAHPFAPTLGQGACQAIEDAVMLATCLDRVQDITSALRTYQDRRIKRAKTMTLLSRRMGRIGQWENPIACWLRNSFIKRTPQFLRLGQMQGMFHFER